jgi:mannose-6-phosphate isomerase-like protein (cupin superfamily)
LNEEDFMKIDTAQFKKYEVLGEERQGIKKRIFEQVHEWGLKIPEVDFLMVHFGLDDFFRTGETEFWVSNEVDAGYCAKLIFVFDKQTCPYHFHKVKHETFYILKGKTRMMVNGEELVKETGDLLVVPTETKHSFTGQGPCLLLEVSMPSVPGDSYFENRGIGNNGVL